MKEIKEVLTPKRIDEIITAWIEFDKQLIQAVVPTETFYYLKSSHGDNFYKVLDTIQVKNEFHDWREYVSYMQLGTQKIFHKPTQMFYSEFKRVEV